MSRETNATLRAIAQAYNDQQGLDRIYDHNVPLDVEYSTATALAYAKLPELSDDAVPAYNAFNGETHAQYLWLTQHGYTFSPAYKDPYPTSADMRADVSHDHHLIYYAGSTSHPYMTHPQQCEFRAVHDVMAHAAGGYEFGPRGEFNAALHHAMMYSPLARTALLSETHGQNSYVNYGPHATHNRTNPSATIYAPQRAALLPASIIATFNVILASIREDI